MAFSIGETLQTGKYRLDALLDERQGGMTFLATHGGVEQQVVIKTFQATTNGPSQAQFKSYVNYAQRLSRFHHPHLSRVISLFEEDNRACMVSEFIQGTPLSQRIQDHPLDEVTAIEYIRQVAQGLHALHRHGLLHLNLRPSRILKRQGETKAVLVGLNSRFASDPSERDGNPYLSPEQHQIPATVSLASEIYGIAATLYTLVTGQVPTTACDRPETGLTPPRTLRPEISPALESAIMQGMALDPRDRPQRMQDWIKLLPQSPQTETQTKLQIPSAWQVKLPTFEEKEANNPVSTVKPLNPAPKTTLQGSTTNRSAADSTPQKPGNPELDSVVAERSPEPAPKATKTTLQVQPQAAVQAVPNHSTPEHPSQTKAPSKPVVKPATPVAASASRGQVSPYTDMTTALPQKHRRFPKWALFWCALIAACGGLGAGLWFRIQLTRQFAMPATPGQNSPLEELKSLDTREEEFLPTQTSIIPEERADRSTEGEFYDDPEFTDSARDDYNTNADFETERAPDEWREPSPRTEYDGQRSVRELREDPLLESQPTGIPDDPVVVEPLAPDSFEDPNTLDLEGVPQVPAQPLESESLEPLDSYGEYSNEDGFTSNGSSFDPTSGTL